MFQTLLNQPRRDVVTEEYDTVEQNIERPSLEEVETGLDMLKNGKAPGANYIIPELNRERLWKVMDQLGIRRKIIRVIRACVNGSKCKVKYGGEESEEFEVRTGLRQGDALSQALFNIALESAMRETLDGATGIKIRNDQQLVVAGYADDVIIMAESEEDLKKTTSKLIEEGGKIGLMINEEKTKYMIVTRYNHEIRHMKVNNYNFERVANFKYLGVNINENADSHEEIRLRLIAANKCYFGLVPLLKSKLISWKTKITLYKVLIRPVALYACGAWATTVTDENRLATFERKVLRRIFGPKRNALGDFELRTNREVEELYGETNINGVLKSSRLGMSWSYVEIWRPHRIGHGLEARHKKTERTTQTAVERQDYKRCIETGSE
ncbi:hypothetical protein QTP88_022774 [Uroleucon formosanum]